MIRQVFFRAVLRLTLTVLALLLGQTAAQAENNIVPTLVAETRQPAPGSTVLLAIAMKPKPGWHGYWKNPGDAGVPLDLKWVAPPGTNFGLPRFPVPERLLISGLMNHVFNGDHAILVAVTVPAGMKRGTPLPLRAAIQYLSCTDRVCVPEQADVRLSLSVGDGEIVAQDRARFDEWLSKLPHPLGSEASFARTGNILRIGIPFPASTKADTPWFFAATEDIVKYGAAQTVSRRGDMLIIDIEAAGEDTPAQLSGVLSLGGTLGLDVSARPGDVKAGLNPVRVSAGVDHSTGATPPSGGPAVDAASAVPAGLLVSLFGALVGGLILNVMPCVFPIISLKALSIARTGSGNERAIKKEALAYSAGTILTCLGLGGLLLALRAGGVAVGWAFQLQDPRVILVLLLLCTAIALNMLGVFHLRSFGGGERLAGQGGTAGAFWTGALAAFVATPCTGPFMAAALGAALVLPTASALAIFAGLGIGLALPFLLLGFVPAFRTRMPKPGPWMETFQRWMALPMVLTALALGWLLWRQTGTTGLALGMGAATVLGLGLVITRQSRQPNLGRLVMGAILLSAIAAIIGLPRVGEQGAAEMRTGTEAFSSERLAALRTEKRPVFLYFTADWCVTCKVNEKAAIERDEVSKAFKAANVTVMVGDWTSGDAAITRFLESQGRSGVPLYMMYRPGSAKPEILPQVLTPQMLVNLVR